MTPHQLSSPPPAPRKLLKWMNALRIYVRAWTKDTGSSAKHKNRKILMSGKGIKPFSLFCDQQKVGAGGGGTPWDPLLDQPLLFMSNFSVLGELNTQTQSYFYWQTWFVLGDFYIGFHTINKQTSTYSLQHSIVVSINTSWTVWEVPGMFRTERVNKNVLNM